MLKNNPTISDLQRTDHLSIQLEDINIDKRYQREPTWSRIKDIAKTFDERAPGRLMVNMRDDGTLWLIDGQHRFLAMKSKGIKEWQCDVLYSLTLEEEAELFTIRNSRTRVANILEKHHAKVIYKDPTAIAVDNILQSFELHIPKVGGGRNPEGAVIAVGCLYELYSVKDSGEGLKNILTLIKKTWGRRPKAYTQSMLVGVGYIIKRHPTSFREDRFIKQLGKLEPSVVTARAASLAELEGSGAKDAMYKILVHEYNRNLSTVFKLDIR